MSFIKFYIIIYFVEDSSIKLKQYCFNLIEAQSFLRALRNEEGIGEYSITPSGKWICPDSEEPIELFDDEDLWE